MKKSQRLLPVKNLNQQKERVEAKKLAMAQQQLLSAKQKQQELEGYLSEYFSVISAEQDKVKTASQLGLYQTFITRLKQAIENQQEAVKQHELVLKGQTEHWIKANEKLVMMGELIEKLKKSENIEAEKKEQKVLDDRPFMGKSGFE